MRPALRAILLPLAGLALAACGAQEPVTDSEKALFVRVSDLAQFGVRYPNAEAAETFSKSKQLDGSYEITYRFETPSGESRALFIHGSVSVGREMTDAMLAESAEKIGLLVAFKKSGVQEREVAGVSPGKLTLLVKDEQPIGNVFTLRDGAKTHFFVMSGLYVKDPAIWQKLMGPKLEQLSRYSPAAKG